MAGARRAVARVTALLAGQWFYGTSMAFLVRARLGLDPWDVLHQRLAQRLGWSFGAAEAVRISVADGVAFISSAEQERPGRAGQQRVDPPLAEGRPEVGMEQSADRRTWYSLAMATDAQLCPARGSGPIGGDRVTRVHQGRSPGPVSRALT